MRCIYCGENYERPIRFTYDYKCYKRFVFKRKLKRIFNELLTTFISTSILLAIFLILNGLIWLVETYIK